MEEADSPIELQVIAQKVEELELYIQELQGQEKNLCNFKFWEMPQCECNKSINEEMYGSGNVVYADYCPIHSWLA